MDSIWLAMDRPENLMVIVSVVFLDGTPDWDAVTHIFQERVLDRYPVFRQRHEPARGLTGRPHWVDDVDFDITRHLHRARLPRPGDDAALQRWMEDRLAVPFDPAHPLWEAYLVEGHGSGAAIVTRIHHSLADGLALGRVLMSLTDEVPGTAPAAAPTPEQNGNGHEAGSDDPGPGLFSSSISLARAAVGEALRLGTPGGMLAATRLSLTTTKVLSDLILGHNPDNPVSGTPGPAKRIAWTAPIPLDRAKSIGRLAGATLNDVLLSAMAAALRTYQEEAGTEPVDLITMVPVNLRDLSAPLPPELGNEFTLIYFKFPSATAAPLARLGETKRRMDWLKASPEIALTHLLMQVIGRVGHGLDRPVIDFFADKAIGVTTNVIGPRSRRLLGGVPVEGVLGWVPGSGRHTLGVCIFTYAGTVRVGVVSDARVIPDPDRLVAGFEAELGVFGALAPVPAAVEG
jgi:WS/DGAT/MGAT family acyltransferase